MFNRQRQEVHFIVIDHEKGFIHTRTKSFIKAQFLRLKYRLINKEDVRIIWEIITYRKGFKKNKRKKGH